MNNPRKILSKEDVKILESNDIVVPDKELSDSEWFEFEIEISKKLKLDDLERIMDVLADSD